MREGERYKNKKGLWYEIVDYKNAREVYIRFDKTGYTKKTKYCHCRSGAVKDPTAPSIFNIGYTDGLPTKLNGKLRKDYSVWFSMFDRCYNPKRNYKSYYGVVTVDEYWLHFKNFKLWFKDNYKEGYSLDKDLLSNLRGVPPKYSSDTCVFVPNTVNNAVAHCRDTSGNHRKGCHVDLKTGYYISQLSVDNETTYLGYTKSKENAEALYKKNKEANLKRLAGKYFSSGSITPLTYLALLAWKV